MINTKKIQYCVLAAFAGAASPSFAAVELDPLFTDGMVLQRGDRTRVWGTASPGEKVCVRYGEPSWFFGLGDTTVETTAGEDGRWSVRFESLSACDEGRTLYVIGGDSELCLTNVVVGDVWVCSGQSNMEMPVTGDGPFWRAANHLEEVAAAQDPLLRVFRIPWRLNAINPECRVEGGPWVVAVGRENFRKAKISASAYFFGRQLRRDVKVPIGLIQVPWSGSNIQPWISYSGYVNAGLGKEVRALDHRYANAAKVKEAKDWKAKYVYSGAEFETELANWRKAFFASSPKMTAEATNKWWRAEFNDSDWEPVRDVQGDMVPSPHPWDNGKLVKGGAFPPGKDGVQWYRQSVSVKADCAGQDAELHLGNVDDEDETWFNGVKVGARGDCMAKRVYRIPARLVKPGNNVIAVRAVDLKMYGCFNMPEEQRLVLADGTSYPLAKGWKAKIEFIANTKQIGEYPTPKMGEAYCSTAMFNAMINPIARLAVTGVIWYQGCSNAGQPAYYDLHKALIADWRRAFDLPQMPFLIVQLASYEGHQPANPRKDDFYLSEPCKADYPFALTREIQARVRDDVENVGLAVTMDIGDHSDIHPRNKQDVGRRLALEAERIAYGRNVVSQGPRFAGAEFAGGKAIVSFTHAEGLTTSDGKAPGAFALGGRDGKFAWATAKIVGDRVEVSSPEVKDPVAVRYAYVSYRGDCNLVNGAGLPAEPFRFQVK